MCLLPTASGDPTDQIAAFRRFFGELDCELSHLSLFRLESERVSLAERLLSQDLIYVGGGSMLNLLAIWRAHGIDAILRQAWERGIILVGQSAGAMCWFEAGISLSAGSASVVDGLGLVPGIISVHYHRDPERRAALLAVVRDRATMGYGVDDHAGLVIRGTSVAAAVSGKDEAGAWRVEPDRPGVPREVRLRQVPLPAPRPAIEEMGSDVRELREVRAARIAANAPPRR